MLTAERLREVLYYDLSSGEFRWRVSTGPRAHVGAIAGFTLDRNNCSDSRHRRVCRVIKVDGGRYYASRLAWLYVHGVWPTHHVDHKNVNPMDDSFDNLRDATRHQNQGNLRLNRRSTSGCKGVSWSTRAGRWRAYIQVGNVYRHLGYFDDVENASQAYITAAVKAFGEFARAA